MAVGLERAHAQCLSQGQGLPVVDFRLLDLWWLAPRRDLTEKPEGIGFMAPFLVRTDERQCTLGDSVRLPRRPASRCASPRGRLQSACRLTLSNAMVCSSACVSSGMASVTRPPKM